MSELFQFSLIVLTNAAAIGLLCAAISHGLIESILTSVSQTHVWVGPYGGRHAATDYDVWRHRTGGDTGDLEKVHKTLGFLAALGIAGLEIVFPPPCLRLSALPTEWWQYVVLGVLFLIAFSSGAKTAKEICLQRETYWGLKLLIVIASAAAVPILLGASYKQEMSWLVLVLTFSVSSVALLLCIVLAVFGVVTRRFGDREPIVPIPGTFVLYIAIGIGSLIALS